jgi:uncharacterized protein (UPF0276 family)
LRFALNYSPEAVALYEAGRIELDLFKVPNWDSLVDEVLPRHPLYVHFKFQAGQGDVTPETLAQAAQLRDKTRTPWINTHLIPRLTDARDPYDADEIVDIMLRDIRPLVDCFGAANVVAENIPFPERMRDKSPRCVEPDVIRRTIEAADVGFLLDIGHARRTAEHLAQDPRRYIEALPVERLRELHVTGLGYDNSGHRVDHLPMREDDWELFQWVLDGICAGRFPRPGIIACEYGGVGEGFRWRSDSAVIAEQVPRMLVMVRNAICERV